MRVAITGASGFVGKPLLKRLQNEAQIVELGRRHKVNSLSEFMLFDLSAPSSNDLNLSGVDVVVHLAALVHQMGDSSSDLKAKYYRYNTSATIELAKQAEKNGVKRFIFISSIKVNGESTSNRSAFSHLDPISPTDDYGQSKSEAETWLLEWSHQTDMEVVIIRPPLVYGPGVKANFRSLLALVNKGIPLPFGSLTSNRRSLVSVSNLVDLIVTCISHPEAKNQTFLVSDDYDLSTSQMVSLMAESLGVRKLQLPFPLKCFEVLARLLKKSEAVDRLTGSLEVDITHTKNILNWAPPQTTKEAFFETATHYKNKDLNND